MSDLFEDARPVRDATLAELERVLAQDTELPWFVKDGNRLGCQMTSLMMTFVMQKLEGRSGEIENDGLRDFLAIAIAQSIAYAVTSFRPVRDGAPISPLQNLNEFGSLLGHHAEKQVGMQQAGLQDFVVPFRYRDGVIEPVGFDVMDMLKSEGKP